MHSVSRPTGAGQPVARTMPGEGSPRGLTATLAAGRDGARGHAATFALKQDGARGRAVRAAAAAVISALVAACSSTGGGAPSASFITPASSTPLPSKDKPHYTAADFSKDTYCPPVVIRAGTEAMSLYDHGHDADPDYVRFLGSIGKTARECHQDGDMLSLKIGISGRVVAGPKGSAGTITLPLRIAVTKQVSVGKPPLYSQLFKIQVPVAAPTLSADYSQVFDQVKVKIGPDDHDLIVYVGFDEAKKKDKVAAQD
jgi:hypothetical protein